ncbi:MAG: R3H domain-containing nucleic acid-binding protein [Candidatus Microsaccharimonas sp.]
MNKEESVEYAKKYIADLLSFFGINVTVEAFVEDDVIELSVPSTDINSLLIGRSAETLRSLQFLVSNVLRNKDAAFSRVNLDIADYKKQRADRLAEKAREWIIEVRKTGDSHVEHLNAADRRIVHQVASEYSDVQTFSSGEGFDRIITITQASS